MSESWKTTAMICPACETDGSASVMDDDGCPNCGHRDRHWKTQTVIPLPPGITVTM